LSDKKYTMQELRALFEHNEKDYVQLISDQRRHEALFSSFDITPSEYRALAVMFLNDGGSEPSIIADSLMILRQTMTKIIDSLEAKRLVLRTVHPTDRRRVYVKLLPTGQKLAEQLLVLESEYISMVQAQFTQEELDTLSSLFQKMQLARENALRQLNVGK